MPRASSSARRAWSPSSRARRAAADALAATARSCADARSASAALARSRACSCRPAAARSARDRLVERCPGRAEIGLQRRASLGCGRGLGRLVRRSSLDLGQPPPCGVGLRLPGGCRPTKRGQLLPVRLPRAPKSRELGQGVGQLSFRLAEERFQIEIPRRDWRRLRASPGGELRLGSGTLVEQPPAVAFERLEIRCQPRIAQLGGGRSGTRGLVRVPPVALERGADGAFGRQRRGPGLGGGQLGHRRVDGRPRPVAVRIGDRQAAGGLVPARVHREQQGTGQLLGRGFAARLLLGLGGQPAGLRPQFAEDVLDAGEVRLRFDQLLLGAAAPAFVAPDPGDLLEERPALLGAQGERLVDHPLPDEQEGVVGEMGRVEQVDQVAQPDPALVEQVVVLAASIEPAPQLEDLEIDWEEPVGVVDHEGDIGHPLCRALLRARPDDVLRLARAQRPALLAERPAQRVGEVALARSVWPDDRADPRTELDVGPLRE